MNGDLPKAILFDLDDTIIRHENPAKTWKRISTRYAPLADGAKPSALFKAIEERRNWFWDNPERHRSGRLNPVRATRDIVTHALQSLGVNPGGLAMEITNTYIEQRRKAETLSPGASDALAQLRKKGISLGLVTNGGIEPQRGKVERHDLAGLFDEILIEGEFGIGKPDPRVYNHILDKLHTAPRDAWMVGNDLQWEVAAPQRLGIYSIWIDLEDAGLPENPPATPDRIINTIPELL